MIELAQPPAPAHTFSPLPATVAPASTGPSPHKTHPTNIRDNSYTNETNRTNMMTCDETTINSAQPTHRVRKGQKLEDVFPTAPTAPPSLQAIDSPFQLQEYLTLLIRQDPHNVERLCALPEGEVVSGKSFTDEKGKAKEAIEDEPQPVDTDVWIYEHLRRIVLDLSTPWLTTLQQECDKRRNPNTCDAMNAGDWMYLCASHGEEKQCCAIDYIIHTLDGTGALLNSARHFPSRTYIPSTSLRHFGSISRRLSRIFVHAWHHHREAFESCEAETSLYARFYTLVQTFDLISVDGLPQPPALRRGAQSAATADADAEQDETDDFAPRGPRPTSILQWSETGAGLKRADSARSRKMVMHVGAGEDVNRRGPPPNDAPEEVTENEDEWETKEIHEDSGNPPDAVTSEASSEHAPEASAHDAKEEDTAPLAPAQGQPATAETPAPEKEEASVSTLAEEASPEPSSAASASQQSEEGSKDEQSSAPALEAEKEFAEPEIVPSDSTASAVSESEKEPEPEPGSEAEAPASTEAPTAEGLAGGELAPSAAHPELDAPAPKEEAAASADPDAAAGADAGIAPTPAPAESEVELGEVKIEEEEQGADVKEEE